MNTIKMISNVVFSKTIENFGTLQLRPLDLDTDIPLIHEWVTKPYASYWEMQDSSLEAVQESYTAVTALAHHDVFIGMYNEEAVFLMERYSATKDPISAYYPVQEGDYGMHLLVAPPTEKIHGFTWHIFTTILDYFFSNDLVNRVVVEPDVNNKKIHALNVKAGFQYESTIELPHKKAALAFCERVNYKTAKMNVETKENRLKKKE